MYNKPYLLLLLLCFGFGQTWHVHAQNFSYKCPVPKASKNGFYEILLPTELGAHCQTNYEDLRLFDAEGKEIPFLFRRDEAQTLTEIFQALTIRKTGQENGIQFLEIENPNKTKLNQLLVQIANADAERLLRISGSEDGNNWYVVRDGFYFSALDFSAEDVIFKAIDFPPSSYAYFKIEIKLGNSKQPLNIVSIGQRNQQARYHAPQTIPGVTFSRKDSAKHTRIEIKLNPANQVDRLRWVISSPAMFQRKANILWNEEIQTPYETMPSQSMKIKRGPLQSNHDMLFTMHSEQPALLNLHPEFLRKKINTLIIDIDNQDNEVLRIDSVFAEQYSTRLVAQLQANKQYVVYCGDSLLPAPSYDLVYFQNKIPASLSALVAGPVMTKTANLPGEYSKASDRKLVWIASGVLCLILLALSAQMLRSMRQAAPKNGAEGTKQPAD